MKYTIQSINDKTFEDKQTKQKVILPGYAFIDEFNHTITIVYGNANKIRIINLFKN